MSITNMTFHLETALQKTAAIINIIMLQNNRAVILIRKSQQTNNIPAALLIWPRHTNLYQLFDK